MYVHTDFDESRSNCSRVIVVTDKQKKQKKTDAAQHSTFPANAVGNKIFFTVLRVYKHIGTVAHAVTHLCAEKFCFTMVAVLFSFTADGDISLLINCIQSLYLGSLNDGSLYCCKMLENIQRVPNMCYTKPDIRDFLKLKIIFCAGLKKNGTLYSGTLS